MDTLGHYAERSVKSLECSAADSQNIMPSEPGGSGGGGGGGGCSSALSPGDDPMLLYAPSAAATRRSFLRCSCVECPDDPCCGGSPIVIDLDGGGIKLTGTNDPVRFDLDVTGRAETMGWTEPGSLTAFLALDLDQNGSIDNGRELFGTYTLMPGGERAQNGYEALKVYDGPDFGGNGDGEVSASDAVYSKLSLWIDLNHNGRTDPGDLVDLAAAGVESIRLDYRDGSRVDRWGNAFKYRRLPLSQKRVTAAGGTTPTTFTL